MITQNQEISYYETFEEAYLNCTFPDSEIWERIDSTDNFKKVWPQ